MNNSTALSKSPSDKADIASPLFSLAASWSSSETILSESPFSGGSDDSSSVKNH